MLGAIAGHPGYAILALDGPQAAELSALVGVKEPRDRLVLVAARATEARLLGAGDRARMNPSPT